METLWRDVKYGVRTLLRSPGFTAIAVLTLALGIGANTAIFSVVHGVVLSSLPYRQPDQLVVVWAKNPQGRNMGRNISPSYPDFQDWQRNTRSFQEMAAFTLQAYDLTNPGSPEHLDGWLVSPGFFRTLGVTLTLGRDFSPEESQRGGETGGHHQRAAVESAVRRQQSRSGQGCNARWHGLHNRWSSAARDQSGRHNRHLHAG